jgi:hypothetical protein
MIWAILKPMLILVKMSPTMRTIWTRRIMRNTLGNTRDRWSRLRLRSIHNKRGSVNRRGTIRNHGMRERGGTTSHNSIERQVLTEGHNLDSRVTRRRQLDLSDNILVHRMKTIQEDIPKKVVAEDITRMLRGLIGTHEELIGLLK